ncbi:EpsG family protein [Vibrio parahaemolyticus]|uniref:Transmembrane protein EpsG n=1 Tax=Vibrio parahaemolyticus TaxID=670 RepID=A0A7M1W2U0_VIBPH|nr:transmembrane protein EpsG [Vibrio parahaemolyticus]QOS14742.1 transmembrane protein EpsG [Vibrio parahaemolyticus]QOS15892.1 transmembrane protein EpsG [Vibrio parahaemolyticus]QOS19572.1 transmembrane protein EpsG [Vibrio parahaemolyticus]QOS20470.1 transmembrane protein EpsG [Vibrio parahaemolyticus]
MIYTFIYLTILLFSSFQAFCRSRSRTFYFLLFCSAIILVLFSGTRFETGNDWREYTSLFNRVSVLSDDNNFEQFRVEYIYLLVNSAIKSIGFDNVGWVFLVYSFFTIFIIVFSFGKYSPLVFVCMLVYMRYGFLQFNFMFMRQGIVCSLFYLLLSNVINARFVRYFTSVIIFTFLHKSAIVFIPAYFFLIKRWKKSTLYALLIIAFIFGNFVWINVFINLIPIPSIKSMIYGYVNNEIWARSKIISLSYLDKGFALIYCLENRKRFESFKYFNVILNLCFLSLFSSFLFAFNVVFSERISIYFNISYCFLWSYIIYTLDIRARFVLTLGLIVFYGLWFISYTSGDAFQPYKSFLF